MATDLPACLAALPAARAAPEIPPTAEPAARFACSALAAAALPCRVAAALVPAVCDLAFFAFRSLVAAAGYLNVGWDVAADDWDFGVTADDVFMNVVPNVVDGSIVEFHLDAPSSGESTAVAIPWIVERLEAKGFEFVTIEEMARPCPSAPRTAPSAPTVPTATPTG